MNWEISNGLYVDNYFGDGTVVLLTQRGIDWLSRVVEIINT